MAVIHKATLQPTKLELIAAWLPSRSWFDGDAGELAQVGAFRFDDRAGQVGLQVLLVQAGRRSPVLQVPMTYRDAPLDGATDALLGEMSHSVLGHRYVYDGCHDPVFVGELVQTVLTGGTEVDEVVEIDGEAITMPKSMAVRGSGTAGAAVPDLGPLDVDTAGPDGAVAVVRAGSVEVTVPRVLAAGAAPDGARLDATWDHGGSGWLAVVRVLGS